jgi:hypothetical protein
VTLNSGVSPSITFSGTQTETDDVAGLVLTATAGAYSTASSAGSIAVTAATASGLSIAYDNNEGYATTDGTASGSKPRYSGAPITPIAGGPMYWESGFATKDGTIIEAFYGNHASPANRVGEWSPATGAMAEVFPNNGGTVGVRGYDNQNYCYFDSIDSLVFSKGAFNRTTATSTPSSVTDGSCWTHVFVPDAAHPGDITTTPPNGRPGLSTTSSTGNALIYVPLANDAVWYYVATHYNSHIAYSRQHDACVIIGGGQGDTDPVESSSARYLAVIVPSWRAGTYTPRYYAAIRSYSVAEITNGDSYWMFEDGRAGCKFLGNYVYWGGGRANNIQHRSFYRADIRPVLANPTASLATTFVVERLTDIPDNRPGGGDGYGLLMADPYNQALVYLGMQGANLYDPSTDSWTHITPQLSTDSLYSYWQSNTSLFGHWHGDFVDYVAATGQRPRKMYFFGGYDGSTSQSDSTFTDKFTKVRSIQVTRNADADWSSRATASGVLWAHDFRESQNEIDYFTYGSTEAASTSVVRTNVDPATQPNPLTRVATDLGGSYALKCKIIGATITAPTPSGVAGDTHTFNVSDASTFPDPTTLPALKYIAYVGQWDEYAYEIVEVIGRDTTLNTLTVKRRMSGDTMPSGPFFYAYPTAPSWPAGWTIGLAPSSKWIRPFGAFPAGQNGKAAADIGITNATARKTRTWTTTRNSNAHLNFREAYFGSKWYWDTATNPSAPYATWTSPQDGIARTIAWEGDEFYLQFRVKLSAARLAQGRRKLVYLQCAATSGPGQLFIESGKQLYNEVMVEGEKIPGISTYGGAALSFCGGGDGRQPAGGYLLSGTQTTGYPDAGVNYPFQTDYPQMTYSRANSSNGYGFCWPADTWVTVLVHMKLGRDNAEAYHPAGRGFSNWPTPFPSASDASYRTTCEVKVHLQGWSDYRTLSSATNLTWFFGDLLEQLGYLQYNPPGLSAAWITEYPNMYVGGGSKGPFTSTTEVQYTQVILSKNPIAVPLA